MILKIHLIHTFILILKITWQVFLEPSYLNTIKSSNNEKPSYLTSWVIEGSNDNYNWILIDSHYDDRSLVGKYKVCTFTVQN